MFLLLPLKKGFIKTYTRKDGTVVKAHTDKRISKTHTASNRARSIWKRDETHKQALKRYTGRHQKLIEDAKETLQHHEALEVASKAKKSHSEHGISVEQHHHVKKHLHNLNQKLEDSSQRIMLHQNKTSMMGDKKPVSKTKVVSKKVERTDTLKQLEDRNKVLISTMKDLYAIFNPLAGKNSKAGDAAQKKWYSAQRESSEIRQKISSMRVSTPKGDGKTQAARDMEEKRAVKEANVTSLTHERWKKRTSKEIDSRFSGRGGLGPVSETKTSLLGDKKDKKVVSKPKESKPVYKLEKVGNKYNIHYPTFKGTQGLIEGQTIKQAKEFFERQGNKAGEFEGKEHLSGKKSPTKKISIPKGIQIPDKENKIESKGKRLLRSGKGKNWSKDKTSISSATRTYFSIQDSSKVLDEAGIKSQGHEQIYYDITNKEWSSNDLGGGNLKKLNDYLEPKTKEQKKIEKSNSAVKKQSEIEKYGIIPKALAGTIRQKSWGNTIRSKILDSGKLTKDQTRALLTSGGFTNSSKFWIDNRSVDPSEFTAENIVRKYRGLQELENEHRDFLSRTNPTYEKEKRRKEIKDYLENSTFKFESDLV